MLALATYSGTTVSPITNKLAKNTREILGQDFIMVADKEWYCGQHIEELHEEFGVDVLVPIKRTKNRIEEFDSIPLHLYEKSIWGAEVLSGNKDDKEYNYDKLDEMDGFVERISFNNDTFHYIADSSLFTYKNVKKTNKNGIKIISRVLETSKEPKQLIEKA